jgi:hypothetical protein
MTKSKNLSWSTLAVAGLAVSSAAVIGLWVSSSPAAAGGPACPAFTSEMVDAAAMAFGMPPGSIATVEVRDDPSLPSVYCRFERPLSAGGDRFVVDVNDGSTGEAFVVGRHRSEDEPEVNFRPELFSFAEDLTTGQKHACRAAVQNSWVWNSHCAPALQ